MRTTAAAAGIKMVPSFGLAATAIAPNVWNENWKPLASHFSNHFATH